MDKAEKLRTIIARLADVDAASVVNGFSLAHRSFQGSAGRAKLDALVRKELGMKCPAVYTAKSYSELEAAICGTTAAPAANEIVKTAPAPATTAATTAPPSGLLCGIDIEEVATMPETQDYWSTPFYQEFFSAREIAYCVSQASPREHFAARWCAKEALKKCDASLKSLDWKQMEVVHDDAGRPMMKAQINGEWRALPHAVSLSHTKIFATAMVVAAGKSG